jgi:hypothetical protein
MGDKKYNYKAIKEIKDKAIRKKLEWRQFRRCYKSAKENPELRIKDLSSVELQYQINIYKVIRLSNMNLLRKTSKGNFDILPFNRKNIYQIVGICLIGMGGSFALWLYLETVI